MTHDFENRKRKENEKMEEKNKRNKYLKIRVSEEELNAIKRKFQNSEMNILSDFVFAYPTNETKTINYI